MAVRPVQAPEGLSHSCEPESEEEVIVLEEPERPEACEPNVIRAPRDPTQKEIEVHEATHLPHAEWCEFCMSGRGRNNPHKRKTSKDATAPSKEELEDNPAGSGRESGAGGTSNGPHASDEAETRPVPRVCMDYVYVSSTSEGPTVGAAGLSTRELRHKLKELGKST